jgi:hypothetical protein
MSGGEKQQDELAADQLSDDDVDAVKTEAAWACRSRHPVTISAGPSEVWSRRGGPLRAGRLVAFLPLSPRAVPVESYAHRDRRRHGTAALTPRGERDRPTQRGFVADALGIDGGYGRRERRDAGPGTHSPGPTRRSASHPKWVR